MNNWYSVNKSGEFEFFGDFFPHFDIIMHCVQKAVKSLKFAFESDQSNKFHANFCIIEILLEFMIDINFYQSFMLKVFIVRISAYTANS